MIINEETGEVINEVVDPHKQELADLFTDQIFDMYYQWQAYNEMKEEFEYKLKGLMREYGVKDIDNRYIHITYIPESETKRVDTELLKQAGLYDKFLKVSKRKDSIRVKVKD